MEYRNPTPVAVCLIPVRLPLHREIALMCIVRNNEPAKGLLAFPGGYVEEGETAQAAAARELLEETGMRTTADQWKLTDSKTNAKNRILLFCQFHRTLSCAEYKDLVKLEAHDPAEVAGFALLTEDKVVPPMEPGERKDYVGFPLHVEAARQFFSRKRQAQERARNAARAVLERLADRGDIDEQTQDEMLSEVAQLVLLHN